MMKIKNAHVDADAVMNATVMKTVIVDAMMEKNVHVEMIATVKNKKGELLNE